MSLHVPTLLVALVCAFTLFGASLTFARPVLLQGPELKLWALSSWVMVAAFVLLASRLFLPEAIAIVCGNGLIFVSLYLSSRALYLFILRQRAPAWHLGLVAIGWIAATLVLPLPLSLRTAVLSGLFALQMFPMALLILRRGWHAETSLRTVAVTLGLGVVALVIRVINALLHPEDYSSYFQTSLGNSLTYLTSFLFPLGAGFGFVLANLERIAQRLDKLATYDSLTGCLSRGAFDAMLGHAIAHAFRSRTPISLMVIDLDHFKAINDAYGHLVGDAVLREFSGRLRSRLRAADMFGRVGGDEFGVILSETAANGALSLAEELRRTCEALEVPGLNNPLQRISSSIGVATTFPDATVTLESLYAMADKALYDAKHLGRNRVERYQSPGALASSEG